MLLWLCSAKFFYGYGRSSGMVSFDVTNVAVKWRLRQPRTFCLSSSHSRLKVGSGNQVGPFCVPRDDYSQTNSVPRYLTFGFENCTFRDLRQRWLLATCPGGGHPRNPDGENQERRGGRRRKGCCHSRVPEGGGQPLGPARTGKRYALRARAVSLTFWIRMRFDCT